MYIHSDIGAILCNVDDICCCRCDFSFVMRYSFNFMLRSVYFLSPFPIFSLYIAINGYWALDEMNYVYYRGKII